MGKKNKLMKFAELRTYPHVFQNYNPKVPILESNNGQQTELKGQWNEKCFKNNNPLVLELACGRGEYSLGLARLFPNKNFLGVDIKGARIWRGATNSLEEGLTNVAFLRTRIEILEKFIAENEIDEIWITFPDPFLSKENRRLTSPKFLKMYKSFLKKNGVVHLKTDSRTLYDYTLEKIAEDSSITILENDDDIYKSELTPTLAIQTYYEKMHLEKSKKITYLRFTFD